MSFKKPKKDLKNEKLMQDLIEKEDQEIESMENRIIDMAHRTWHSIGGDVLRAVEESIGESCIPRDEVIEVVMDADYMGTHGNDKEAYEHFKTLSFSKKVEIVAKAFPLPIYGW
jgi:hypothetical protein